MKATKITILLCILFIIPTMLVSCNDVGKETQENVATSGNPKPFEIKVEEVSLIKSSSALDVDMDENSSNSEVGPTADEDSEKADDEVLRLHLEISMNNTTNETFENVQHTITLNESAKPFIASAIIERKSDNFFRVVPKDSDDLKQENPTNGLINVSGFEDEWNPLITTEADLIEVHKKTLEQIYDEINSVTVVITWNGGKQEEVLPLKLPRE